MVNCIFLSYPGVPYIEETLEVLKRRDLNVVGKIEATSEVVSNLVPNALRHGAESWLIFFLPNNQQELLILPFPDVPDENYGQRSRNPENFRGYLADLIPIVGSYLTLTREDSYIPLEWIGRFQHIRLDISLKSLLEKISNEQRLQSVVQESRRVLVITSQEIQQKRREVVIEALRTGDPLILDKLDEAFIVENGKICEHLTQQNFEEVVPPIVKRFSDIIDPETRHFLISSETVRKFVYRHSPANFDYSAPGCGLWKAVERELNLSLVLHLRREMNIANVNDPWVGDPRQRYQIIINTGRGHSVDLNEREPRGSDKLKGITLGSMQHMLRQGFHNGVKTELEKLSDLELSYLLGSSRNSLPMHLRQLINLRNGHAHISSMSRKRFEELRELVLPSDNNPETCLVKIFQLKRKVFEH